MTDSDDSDNPVKAAMARVKRVTPELRVVGGKEAKADKPKRSRKRASATVSGPQPLPQAAAEAAPAEDMADETVDDAVEPTIDDSAPPSLTPEQVDRCRESAHWDQNDRDNARRFLLHSGENVRFVPGMEWLTWQGTHWQRDQGNLGARRLAQGLVDFIKAEARLIEASPAQAKTLEAAYAALKKPGQQRTTSEQGLIIKADEIRATLEKRREGRWKWAVSTGNVGKTEAVLKQAAPFKVVEADRLDPNDHQFNTRTCTLNFERVENPDSDPESPTFGWQVEARPHDRADLITKLGEVDYDPAASCATFDTFLARVQPGAEERHFLQVFLGMAILLGRNPEQKLLFNFGEGSNGKSVLLEVIGVIAGSYRKVVDPATFAGENKTDGAKASGDIARLHSARVVTVEELPRGTPLKEGLVKSLTGGSRQVARFNFGDEFEFDPKFTPVMTGNDMPELSGTDHGIWRRVLILNWPVRIPDAEKDRRLPEKLLLERSGVLNWLVKGALDYLTHGLDAFIPRTVRAFTDDYREERDHVGTFLKACVVHEDGKRLRARELYEAYQAWCADNAQKPWTETALGRYLNSRGYAKDRGKVVFYIGIRLVDEFEARPGVDEPGDPGWSPPGS